MAHWQMRGAGLAATAVTSCAAYYRGIVPAAIARVSLSRCTPLAGVGGRRHAHGLGLDPPDAERRSAPCASLGAKPAGCATRHAAGGQIRRSHALAQYAYRTCQSPAGEEERVTRATWTRHVEFSL